MSESLRGLIIHGATTIAASRISPAEVSNVLPTDDVLRGAPGNSARRSSYDIEEHAFEPGSEVRPRQILNARRCIGRPAGTAVRIERLLQQGPKLVDVGRIVLQQTVVIVSHAIGGPRERLW